MIDSIDSTDSIEHGRSTVNHQLSGIRLRVLLLSAFLVSSLSFAMIGEACAQTPVTIEDMNSLLVDWVGEYVEVSGVFVFTGTEVELWTDSFEMQIDYRYNWIHHCVLVDGGAMPPDPGSYQGVEVVVTGLVEEYAFYYPYVGDQYIARISIDNFTAVTSARERPDNGIRPQGQQPGKDIYYSTAACDSCKFALIVSGFNSPDYWNNVKQKYEYKKDVVGLCPENIIVLFKGGSKDATEIPNGTLTGGSFTSGGVFECTRANIDSAFAYIERKIKEKGCEQPEFQFHSTGHGGGYHTETQGTRSPRGYSGGRLDSSGDEGTKIHENDLRFCNPGEFDLDGDGTNDIEVRRIRVLNPPPSYITRVNFDSNGDGTYDQRIGTDTSDGCVDKNSSDWIPPDINRNGAADSVAWDDVLLLGDGEVLVDDELKSKIQGLINRTGLSKSNSRAEFAQCFGGSFVDDLDSVTTESCSASKAGEVSFSSGRGENDYNYYQKYFIDGLSAGRTWEEAHDEAKDSIQAHNVHENPHYDNYGGETTPADIVIPSILRLYQNYPNPFNPITEIRYYLPLDLHVKLEVFDVTGRKLAVLVDRHEESGEKTICWDGRDERGHWLASGVYFYRLVAGDFVQTKKMVLLR